MYSSQSVHQAPKTCHRATESNRNLSSNLHGRHARHGPLQPDAQRACLPSAVLVREPWIHHQQQEISAISYSGDRVSWNDCEFSDYGDQATRTEDQIDQAGSSHGPRSPTTYSSKGVPASRETERHQPSPSNGTSLLPPNSDLPQTSTGTQPSELSGSSQSLRPSHRRSQMVGAPPLDMEWEESNLSIDHPDHNNRRLTPRMGSRLQREENERIMVPPGTVTSHKLPRASSSNPGDSDICQRQVRDIGNPEDGQYHSSCVHQQERRDIIPCTITPSKGSVAMVHREEYPHPSTAFTRVNELHSRHRVQSPPRQVGLEAGPTIFKKIHHLLGPLSIDLFASCLSAQLP